MYMALLNREKVIRLLQKQIACLSLAERQERSLLVALAAALRGHLFARYLSRWVIRLEPKDHKTGASGARRPKFPLPACVSADLDTYLHTWRKYLKPKHDCVFSMANGQKPLDASGLCHMFRDTVHR